MTREKIHDLALSKVDKTKCLILELITGAGKTKVAIDLINHICKKNNNSHAPILILVAKTVHKQTWKDEISKWGGLYSDNIIMECYNSLWKYENKSFSVIVCDEVQHLSDAKKEILETIKIQDCLIGLSATIKKEMKDYFKYFHHAEIITCDLKEAVKDKVLPEPTVYLIPLYLKETGVDYKIKRFGKTILTSQSGYYKQLSSLVEWYKNKFFTTRNERIKNLWLSTAGKRLKWLSEQKEDEVKELLKHFKPNRTLTFCSSIDQAERLGAYSITSKNLKSAEYLDKFNKREINHITAMGILNEGVNLEDCQIGIFCNLNSSEIISRQRVGRLLRHKHPVVIIPYFKETREEELMEKMVGDYNEKRIFTVNFEKMLELIECQINKNHKV